MLDEIEFFELVDEGHASNQKIIVLMGKVEFVVVGSEQDISEHHFSDGIVATSDDTCQVIVDFVFEFSVELE